MITTNIKYGGDLEIGDFIAVGSNYEMNFGWYSGNGKSGTIQFMRPWGVAWLFEQYNKRINNPNFPTENKDKRGFTLEHIEKDFVRKQHFNRVIKITCPDDVFTGRDLQNYLEAKRILTDMKFLKHK
jgi:hypothetical protein